MIPFNSIAPASRQLSLLSVAPSYTITKNAQARNAYGTVAAEIVCAALNLSPIPINGNYAICFDAQDSKGFYEIKSVHRSGKVVIYDWRMEKEASVNAPLTYAILVHRVRGSNGIDIALDMALGGLEILSLPAFIVHGVAKQQPLRKLIKANSNPRFGYNRKGYIDGYRNVPLNALRSLTTKSSPINFLCYNRSIQLNLLSL